MNELVWEGLLEILREGEPSLKASAHLWRRDDLYGSDWGGQLELPVVFRRLLPAEEYSVRLPSGVEARVRVAMGPSTSTMTFPTLTGIGPSPFGTNASRAPAPPADGEAAVPTSATSEPASAPARAEQPAPRERAARGGEGAKAARAQAGTPPAAPAPAQAPVVFSAPTQAEAETTTSSRAPRAAARVRASRAGAVESQPEPGSRFEVEESVERTEALARAFLAAIEARQVIRPLEHAGFEGRAIAAARHDVERIAATLEGALRARRGAAAWAEELRHELTVVAWFAALAAPDDQAEVAVAGQAVLLLLSTIEALLAITAEATRPHDLAEVARAA